MAYGVTCVDTVVGAVLLQGLLTNMSTDVPVQTFVLAACQEQSCHQLEQT